MNITTRERLIEAYRNDKAEVIVNNFNLPPSEIESEISRSHIMILSGTTKDGRDIFTLNRNTVNGNQLDATFPVSLEIAV